jgi:hypothetical protein
MTKLAIGIIAAAAALSLSACDRPEDKTARDESTMPPIAQAPDTQPPYRDPSVPDNPPENTPSAASPVETK